jgi:hypothetical protein
MYPVSAYELKEYLAYYLNDALENVEKTNPKAVTEGRHERLLA